jgi:AraC-like DNA-binding protein
LQNVRLDLNGRSRMPDVLTQLLELTRVRTTLFAITELPEIWGVGFPDGAGAYFHTLSGGDGWLLIDGAEPRSVAAGDLVLLGRGQAHRICSSRRGEIRTVFDPATWTPNVVTALPRGNGPDRVTLVCGAVHTGPTPGRPVLELLPELAHIRDDEAGAAELRLTLQQLRTETARPQAGSTTLLARLGDVLLVQILRHWLQSPSGPEDARTGWAAALRDPRLAATLYAIHTEPARGWTVGALAEIAHLSRSRFTERFRAATGEPPLAYLTRWRLYHAAELLAGGASVSAAARAAGYQSDAAFSRAFARRHGHPPSAHRLRAHRGMSP